MPSPPDPPPPPSEAALTAPPAVPAEGVAEVPAGVVLDGLRMRIDDLDDAILKALDERARVVADVGRAKRDASLPTYDPDRERVILDRLAARAGRFPPEAVRAVYREVMSACLALQEPLKVAYMGPEGTFSHAAARAFFGLAAAYTEATTLAGVFDTVARREAKYGVVPIENSSEGSVDHALDALIAGDLLIRAELELEVDQCLLSRATGLPAIQRVYSHPQALGQCRVWLAKNLAAAQLVQSTSTAAAVREAAADPSFAAVASSLASELYGVPVVRARIQDHAENKTRFVMLAADDSARTGNDKTTLAFSLGDGRGALMRVLAIFDDEDVNLTRIESRPSRAKPWEYVFLADVEGHRTDENIVRALARLRERCAMVKPLGSYPRSR